MSHNEYSRGSMWGIWDLQIQTILDDRYISLQSYYEDIKKKEPVKWEQFVLKVGGEDNAILYDSKDYFSDSTKPKKERCNNYVRTAFSFIEIFKPHLALIGITDHNYYDDCLIDEFFNYSKSTSCKVVCGVEINVNGIHMLVYFGKPPYTKRTFSDGIKEFLSQIGIHNPKKDEVLTVSPKSILEDIIPEIKKQSGLFIYPHCNSNNGLFQERGKTDRTHLADIFNCKSRILLQGSSKENVETISEYIESNKSLFKSEPIFTIASDSRTLNDFGNPDKDRNHLWIKSNPTFNGLLQIIYEPKERVAIQEEEPQQKTDYLVIDKVRFLETASAKLFSERFIEINPNMNAIIGGKSSGKSILLFHIAKTIDPAQVEEQMSIVGEKGYEFEKKISHFDFEVHWRDGFVDKFQSKDKCRQITYVPQLYINHLAEEKGELKLKELIESILEQNSGYKIFIEAERKQIQDVNLEISAEINSLYSLADTIRNLIVEIRKIGDKKAISDNIEKTKRDIDTLRKKAGFNEKENKEYEQFIIQRDFNQTQVERYRAYFNHITEYLQHIEESKSASVERIKYDLENFNQLYDNDASALRYISDNSTEDTRLISEQFDAIVLRYSNALNKIEHKIQKHFALLQAKNENLKPYLTKISNQNLLNQLIKVLEGDQLKIKQIEDKEKTYKDIVDTGKKKKQSLIEKYETLINLYNGILNRLRQDDLNKIPPDLELKTHLIFDITKFTNGFCSLIDGRLNFNSVFGNSFNDKNVFQFMPTDHSKNIQSLFDKIWQSEKNNIKFKSGVEPKDACIKLFEDYFTFKYTIKQNQDDILQMSPGKRGVVLLQLILHLSNAIHPILIDQPEDNLDNRTIFNELNQFIKDKKIQRQIIIVTHNANLVVSTDTEQIIVANQRGQEKNSDNAEYDFEYVTGALENSFPQVKTKKGILYQMGIREHVCDILEGGEDAFRKREERYGF